MLEGRERFGHALNLTCAGLQALGRGSNRSAKKHEATLCGSKAQGVGASASPCAQAPLLNKNGTASWLGKHAVGTNEVSACCGRLDHAPVTDININIINKSTYSGGQ